MKEILAKLVEGKDLTKEEAMKAQELILTGQATEAQIACFLTALRMKGETLDEITGLATVLRNKANTISPKVEDYVDFVGTGGDCTYSFNISTTSAFVVAAAGLPVAKHGNRSISSKSGAGDVRSTWRKYFRRSGCGRKVCGDGRDRIYVCTAF